jgi:membrane-bound metal-dependent hydrolase YbcI (DUF457 family)
MPLPLGHAAIGFAVWDLSARERFFSGGWKASLFIAVLANLPDLDVLIGLLYCGNGSAFHRGPTHSLLFALVGGFFMCHVWGRWFKAVKIRFEECFLVIVSHIAADWALTTTPVSWFWPLEVNWVAGHKNWTDVFNLVFFNGFGDIGIITVCVSIIMLDALVRHRMGQGGIVPQCLRVCQRVFVALLPK